MNILLNVLVYYGLGFLFYLFRIIRNTYLKRTNNVVAPILGLILYSIIICVFTYNTLIPAQITFVTFMFMQICDGCIIGFCWVITEIIGIAVFKYSDKDIERKFITFCIFATYMFVCAVIAIATTLITRNSGAAKAANSVNVSYYQKDKQAKMPVISSKDKQIHLLNSSATVRNWAAMSLNQLTDNPSFYKLDKNVSLQYYHGKLVYLIPLHYTSSVLKHFKSPYIPGYLIVDATTKNAKPKFVKCKMYYSPTHYLNNNASRKMNFKAIENHITTSDDMIFQLDAKGTPYYVSTGYKEYFMSEFSNYSSYHTVTINAITGKVTDYGTGNQPKWLSMCITPETAKAQLSDYAKYKETSYYAFQFFQEKGKKTSTSGNAIIGYHGKIYYVATLQNYNANQKTIDSYVYLDAQTGKLYQYHTSNNVMTPLTACKTAINAMNEKGWQARLPLMYRINGIPTWVITITDDEGVFRKYAYVRGDGLATNDNVAIGDDAQDALTNYLALFNGTDKTISGSETGKRVVNAGVISKIGRFDDNNIRFKLANSAYVYNISTKQSQNAIFLSKGDRVKVTGRLQSNLVVVTTIETKNHK